MTSGAVSGQVLLASGRVLAHLDSWRWRIFGMFPYEFLDVLDWKPKNPYLRCLLRYHIWDHWVYHPSTEIFHTLFSPIRILHPAVQLSSVEFQVASEDGTVSFTTRWTWQNAVMDRCPVPGLSGRPCSGGETFSKLLPVASSLFFLNQRTDYKKKAALMFHVFHSSFFLHFFLLFFCDLYVPIHL